MNTVNNMNNINNIKRLLSFTIFRFTLFGFTFLGFGSLSLACTDFTGTYRDLTNASEVQITQVACSEITTSSEGNRFTMLTDGQYHILNNEEASDNQADSLVTAFYRGIFEAEQLSLDFRIQIDPTNPATDQVSKMILSLDENTNLIEFSTQPNGSTYTTVRTRVK